MTLWDLTVAIFRRWPVLLAGAVVTVVLGVFSIHDNGVYWSRTQVILLAPEAWTSNKLDGSPWEVTKATGAVVKRVVGAGKVIKYASSDANLVGISDVREGTWIRQEDDGGQWSVGLTSPVIIVDATGPTPERTRQLQEAAVARIADTLRTMQDEWGVDPALRVTSTVAPASGVIYHVTGSKIRALGMTTALGVGITVGVIMMLEYRARRRRDPDPLPDQNDVFLVLSNTGSATS